MADAKYDEFDAYGAVRTDKTIAPGRSRRTQAFLNWAGALTSVALIVGLGVWAYNLAVRDVRGVPVIQALEGPARVAPDNPGGDFASHQGMAVNEIAADGTAGAPADRLMLAPRPVELAEEDQPMGELTLPETAVDRAPVPDTGSDFAANPVVPAPQASEGQTAQSLSESLAAEDAAPLVEPLPDGPLDEVSPELDAEGAFAATPLVPADVPGVSSSLRPIARPLSVTSAGAVDAMAEAAAAAVAEAMAPQSVDLDPASLAAGTRLAQIGAFANEADARLEWETMTSRFGALLSDKHRVIEAATSGGKTFFRLRVEGFEDIDDSRRFCAALKAEGAECVPAVVR